MSGATERRPMSDTSKWAGATAVMSAIVGAIMVSAGMSPRLWLVITIVFLASAVASLVSALSNVATPLPWYLHGQSESASARPDRRVQVLAARLRSNARPGAGRRRTNGALTADGHQPADEIVNSLTAVIDDHLRSQHGIDRSNDADAAHTTLGPELARFVSDPVAARSMTQKRTLAHTIELIETFTDSTTTA